MHEGSRKAVLAAFFANLGIAIAKFVGFLITRSASMLAEAIHSVADSANQLLLMLGGSRARKPPTPDHPFGYGRERYFWAFIVALVLFSMGGLFALYEGIEKLRHPHEVESLGVAVTILVVAIVLEAFSLRTAIVESKKVKPARSSWVEFVHRTKEPELPVVLLEDIGAMVGLVFALVGVVLSVVTDNPRFDAAGSIAIGVLLIVIAAVLAWEMKGLLIGEAAAPEVERQIADTLTATPEVRRLIHMRTQHLGPDELLVGAKIEVTSDLDPLRIAEVINEREAALRRAVPAARIIYLEPDVFRAEGVAVSSEGTHQGSSEDTPG